ncbi:MAG: UDP-N-acetylmuramate--L-alanine ligase [Deltaproteobacteria bacterium]|nr:UDP-N-acetylmuramate--L-alanine ligase [Deltaproteobacteria bacterium]
MAKRTRVVHMVGIGGIGMSGIAEVLINLGYRVTGSDKKTSDTTRRLTALGGHVILGHDEHNVEGTDVVVVSSAVRDDNPEVQMARRLKIPVIRRAEMLAELMRLKEGIAVGGTHGKTTTTSLVAWLLQAGGLDPTVVVGGKVNRLGTTAKLGQGPFLVAEADESDGSFLHLSPTIAVVTNIDPEHLDHYQGGIEEIRDTFVSFVNRIPFYGLAVLCGDHSGVQAILPRVVRRRVLYGFSPQAEVQARNIEFDGPRTTFELWYAGTNHGRFLLNMLGEHNVANALAALTVAHELQVPMSVAKDALAEFDGVERRFSVRGHARDVMVVDDYGHHPEEIRATLRGARSAYPKRRMIAVFQPHRYTRTRDHIEEFATAFHDAEIVIVTPIYAAGEDPIEGVTSAYLAEALRRHGHRDVREVSDVDEAVTMLLSDARRGDLVITLGAGDVNRAASRLAEALEQPESFAANEANAATSFGQDGAPGVAAGVSANSEPGVSRDEAAEPKRGKGTP